MTLERAMNDFRKYLQQVERKSPKTYDGYHRDLVRYLRKLAADDDVRAFTPAAVNKVLAAMTEAGLSTATVIRMIAALRKFAQWGLREGHWKTDPTLQVPRLHQPRRHPKPFTQEELARLMALTLPRQEHAIRAILRYTGMRASALCALRPEDVNLEPGRGLAGTIRSIGKGNAETIHPMVPALKDALFDQYLAAQLEGRGPLIWRRTGPIDGCALAHLCRVWGVKAGVAKCHPHRFRHTFATELIREGVNPAVARVLLGHRSIVTTMGYAQVDDAQVAAAALRIGGATVTDRDAEIAALRARLAELEGGPS